MALKLLKDKDGESHSGSPPKGNKRVLKEKENKRDTSVKAKNINPEFLKKAADGIEITTNSPLGNKHQNINNKSPTRENIMKSREEKIFLGNKIKTDASPGKDNNTTVKMNEKTKDDSQNISIDPTIPIRYRESPKVMSLNVVERSPWKERDPGRSEMERILMVCFNENIYKLLF